MVKGFTLCWPAISSVHSSYFSCSGQTNEVTRRIWCHPSRWWTHRLAAAWASWRRPTLPMSSFRTWGRVSYRKHLWNVATHWPRTLRLTLKTGWAFSRYPHHTRADEPHLSRLKWTFYSKCIQSPGNAMDVTIDSLLLSFSMYLYLALLLSLSLCISRSTSLSISFSLCVLISPHVRPWTIHV